MCIEPREVVSRLTNSQTLYTGTVRFNILLGAIKPLEEVTQEELEAACRDANILEFINSLPEYVILSTFLCSSLIITIKVASTLRSVARVASSAAGKSHVIPVLLLFIRVA